jgi:hypothetical protein
MGRAKQLDAPSWQQPVLFAVDKVRTELNQVRVATHTPFNRSCPS